VARHPVVHAGIVPRGQPLPWKGAVVSAEVADWTTISSLATAGGTLVLAAATFASVRSANRAARVAEASLLTGLRPLLLAARPEDVIEKVTWVDEHITRVVGGRGAVEEADGVIYLAAALRNAGAGMAVLHGWHVLTEWDPVSQQSPPAPERFRRQSRDLYIAPGDSGFWQGAIRDGDDEDRAELYEIVTHPRRFQVDLLYGDQEGGQRAITRFIFTPMGDAWLFSAGRHWYLDRAGPR
jgi:hypothetical protein